MASTETMVTLTDDLDALVTEIATATGVTKPMVVEVAVSHFLTVATAPHGVEELLKLRLALLQPRRATRDQSTLSKLKDTPIEDIDISRAYDRVVRYFEDLQDIQDAEEALADPSPRIPWAEVKREFGLGLSG